MQSRKTSEKKMTTFCLWGKKSKLSPSWLFSVFYFNLIIVLVFTFTKSKLRKQIYGFESFSKTIQ